MSKGNTGTEIGLELFKRYAEPARHYHTLDHIDYCLEMFDQVSGQCKEPDAVELAIWFHDAVYDFPVDNNEQMSAEFFMQASDGKLPDKLRTLIFDQIMVTDHRSEVVSDDQKTLIDIDLSSFGRPWERFLTDGINVRREMGYLEDAVFYRNQIAFMRQLVEREFFYLTSWFQQQYEATARNNLKRYLQSLADKGYPIS